MLVRNPYHSFMTKVSAMPPAPEGLYPDNKLQREIYFDAAAAGDPDALVDLETLKALSTSPLYAGDGATQLGQVGLASGLGAGLGGLVGHFARPASSGLLKGALLGAGVVGGVAGLGALGHNRKMKTDPAYAADFVARGQWDPQLVDAAKRAAWERQGAAVSRYRDYLDLNDI